MLAGDVKYAERHFEVYYAIWRKYQSLPERFDYHYRIPNFYNYPLRPELAESTYHLYQVHPKLAG